ncbi:hypothetical protein GFS60_00829 [Rhodococcus sp. WAY2]|nr:hypothetical protein GFS60_00829 [Rhodococcus sp. WAY2]
MGLGIGRLVFRALNSIEMLWAATLVASIVVGAPPAHVRPDHRNIPPRPVGRAPPLPA